MRAVGYAFRQAWASLRRSKASSLFAVTAIALAGTVLGALLLVTWNAERVLAQWTSAAEFSVYLRDDVTPEQRAAIEQAVDDSGLTGGREYVSKDQALTRFRREFAGLAPVADGLDENPFPASIEVRVAAAAERGGRTTGLVGQLAALPGVADVRHDREWLARASSGLETIRAAGFALAALMAAAAAVTVATVVRLGLHARREEVEIMDLVGAPMVFIRGPFVAEGVLQGGLGAALALGLLWLGFALARGWWGADIQAILNGAAVVFLPPMLLISLVAGSMAVGALGGFAAARHAG
jgi:cell division transport system permease protein